MSQIQHYLLQFFTFAHLPAHLQVASKPFAPVAELIDSAAPQAQVSTAVMALRSDLYALPAGPERDVLMDKLDQVDHVYHNPAFARATPLVCTLSLRLLLEAKDCAVRSILYKRPGE